MTSLKLVLDDGRSVSAVLTKAPVTVAWCVLAHGAGAGMLHPFMASVADGLARRHIAVLRYQFPYMEAGSRLPDRPAVAHQAVRTAVRAAVALADDAPVFAGGKSFGARMTSQAQAESALPGVNGFVYFGFPLHAAGKPGVSRAQHLERIGVPMLFVQGTRDALADLGLLEGVVSRLPGATLAVIPEADHSFHIPARTGRTPADVLEQACDTVATWIRTTTRT